MSYAFSFGVGDAYPASSGPCSTRWTRRLLTSGVRLELTLAARFSRPISAMAFCHYAGFCKLRSEVRRLLDKVEFDILWFEHAPNYPFVRELLRGRRAPRLVCNTHNIEYHSYERRGKVAPTSQVAQWLRLQSRILRKVERATFAACDLVVACSETDKRLALELTPTARVHVAGNGVDVAYFQPSPGRKHAPVPTLLFTGTFNYDPNVDAVGYFVSDIFPLIKKRIPECRFLFAGSNAQGAFNALGLRDTSCSCVSDPPDIRPELERAWVFVVPLRAGGALGSRFLKPWRWNAPSCPRLLARKGSPTCQVSTFSWQRLPTSSLQPW